MAPTGGAGAALDAAAGTDRVQLGVLFVHGIGLQSEGDTLVGWGDALIRWLQDWLGADAVRVRSARLRREGEAPLRGYVEMDVDLPGTDGSPAPPQRWRIVESWWAEAFHPPTFRELAFWGFGVLPWVVVAHFRTRFERAWRDARWRSGGVEVLRAVGWVRRVLGELVRLTLATLLSPLLAITVLGMLLLAAIPIRSLRSAAASLQRLLSRTLGDSYVLLGSPSRAAAIVTCVADDLAAMGDCPRLAVVAHSQGAAVAYRALRRSRLSNLRTFITFGSGQAKLDALDDLRGGTAQRQVWLAPLGLLMLIVLVWYGIGQIRSGDEDAWMTLVFLGSFVLALVASGLAATKDPGEPAPEALDVGAVDEWLDLYASHDPVPNGPLFGIRGRRANLETREVRNAGSALRDHTAYWLNRDEFIPAVASALAAAAERSVDRAASPDLAARLLAVARRQWRLRCLTLLRLAAVATLAAAWIAHRDRLPELGRRALNAAIGLVDLVPFWRLERVTGLEGSAPWVGAATLVALVALGYGLVTVPLRMWERADYRRFVARRGYRLFAPELVAAVYAALGLVLLAVLGPDQPPPRVPVRELVALVLAVPIVVMLTWFLVVPLVPVALALLRLGVVRSGRVCPTVPQMAAVMVPAYAATFVIGNAPGRLSLAWVMAGLFGPPLLGWLVPPLLSTVLSPLVRRLRRVAAAEPLSVSGLGLDLGSGLDPQLLYAAEALGAKVEKRIGELKGAIAAPDAAEGSAGDDLRILVPRMVPVKHLRGLRDLTDEAEELALVLHSRGHERAAVALLRAAAGFSRSAAVLLGELAPSEPGVGEILERHAARGPLLGRGRVRRLLDVASA